MKIAFYTPNLNFRGSCVALYDYAHYAETLLGLTSIVLTDRAQQHTNDVIAEDWIRRRFPVYTCSGDMDTVLHQYQCDVLYCIKYGTRDGIVSSTVYTIVHCVFDMSEPHGDQYIAVSSSLAHKFQRTAFLPHMISMTTTPVHETMRASLGIPSSAIVFGRHGGRDTFNLEWAKETISRVVRDRDDIVFVFMNAPEWDTHPRIIHLPPTTDVYEKKRYIQTCDAMVVPETMGHTFGMSIAEFAVHQKPILCYNGPVWNTAHLDMLGETATYFDSPGALYSALTSFRPYTDTAVAQAYASYTPTAVMRAFASYLPTTQY